MWTTFKKSSRSPIVGVVESKKFGIILERERELDMKTWLVFNSKMDVIGSVRAEGYTQAFVIAQNRFRYVDYIQEV